MPGVARRNRVFGGTLKLRDYERARAGSRPCRRGTMAPSSLPSPAGAEDSQRVVVMLISHLPNRTP